MSAPAAIMSRMDIAWPEGWAVEHAQLPNGLRGLTIFAERRSVIAGDLHPWQHTATCVHESIHAADGPVPAWQEAREEQRVNRETARRLIPLPALLHTMRETNDARMAAAILEVPVALIYARLQGLHPSERASLRRSLEVTHDRD